MADARTTVVRNILQHPGTGDPIKNEQVSIRLNVPGFVDSGSTEKIRTRYPTTDDTGLWSVELEVNDDIDPPGTYYTVRETSGVMWSFVVPPSADPVNLRDILVNDPANPTPMTAGVPLPGGTVPEGYVWVTDGDGAGDYGPQSGGGGGAVSWDAVTGKPTVIAAGADSAAARAAIGAGTSSFSGAYTDLAGKPTLGTAAAQDSAAFDPAGAAAAVAGTLAPVATSGSYTDLTNKPSSTPTAWTDVTGKPAVIAAGADQATARAAIGAGTSSFDGAYPSLTSKPTIPSTAGDVGAVPTTRTVAGHALTGDVTLAKADVGLGSVDNTSDTAKPVSTAQAAAITTAINNLVNGAPGALDTLKELADAMGDDPNFAATVTNALALKAPLASPTFTGTVAGVTKSMVGLGSVDNTADTAKPVSTAQQTALNGKAVAGAPAWAATATPRARRFDPTTGCYNAAGANDQKLRVALGKAATDTAGLNIAVLGDSALIGYDGTNYEFAKSIPTRMVKALSSALSGAEGVTGITPAMGAWQTAINPQWTTSATGFSIVAVGHTLALTSSAGWAQFQSLDAGTAIEFYVADGSTTGFTYQIDAEIGTGTVRTAATGGSASALHKETVTGLTRGIHQVRILGVTGNVYILGARVWDPTRNQIQVHNIALGGSRAASGISTQNWTATGTSTGVLKIAHPLMLSTAGVSPDLMVICIGGNDIANSVTAATTFAGVQVMRAFYPTVPCIVMLCWEVTGASSSVTDAFGGLLYDWADTADVTLFDARAIIGTQTVAQANGALGPDNTHPTDGTSAYLGRLLAQTISRTSPDIQGALAGKVDSSVTVAHNGHGVLQSTHITGTPDSANDTNLIEFWVGSELIAWCNEAGLSRMMSHINSKYDAGVRIFRRSDLASTVASAHQGAAYCSFELISVARDEQLWGVRQKDGAQFRNAIRHNDTLVWHTGDPDPTTDTTGFFGYGAASTGYSQTIPATTQVRLICNSAAESWPSWAPSGTERINLGP